MQISEVSVKVCFVGPPRHAVHTGGGVTLERENRRLRRRLPGFVRRLPRYYGGVRLLTIVHHRLRLLASPTRTRAGRVTYLLANREISRFPYKERPHMPRSATAPGRMGTRAGVPIRVAFHSVKSVGARDEVIFAAR